MTYTFKLARRLAANNRRQVAALLVLAVATTACGAGSPSDPSPTPTPTPSAQAGWLSLEFTTPHGDDGAVQISINGPAVDSVRTAAPLKGVAGTASKQSGYVVATGTLTSGTVARIYVPDVSRSGQYTANVQAVAQKGTYALRTLSGYKVSVIR